MVSLSFVDSDMLMNLYSSEPDMSILVDLADQAITLGNTNEYVTLINIAEFYKFITDLRNNLERAFLNQMFEIIKEIIVLTHVLQIL